MTRHLRSMRFAYQEQVSKDVGLRVGRGCLPREEERVWLSCLSLVGRAQERPSA